MNVGHEEEELKPYTEPEPDFNDTKRIGKNRLPQSFQSIAVLFLPSPVLYLFH